MKRRLLERLLCRRHPCSSCTSRDVCCYTRFFREPRVNLRYRVNTAIQRMSILMIYALKTEKPNDINEFARVEPRS